MDMLQPKKTPSKKKKEVRPFLNPDAECPNCKAHVALLRAKNGWMGYFDEIGKPWIKHYCTSETLNYNYKQPSLFIEKVELMKKDYYFYHHEVKIQLKILLLHALALHTPRELNLEAEALARFKQNFIQSIRRIESMLPQNIYNEPLEYARDLITNSTLKTLRSHLLDCYEYCSDIFLFIPHGAWLIIRPPTDPMLKRLYEGLEYSTLIGGIEIYLEPRYAHTPSKSGYEVDEARENLHRAHVTSLAEFLAKYREFLEDQDATINAILDLQEVSPHSDKEKARQRISEDILNIYHNDEQFSDYLGLKKWDKIEPNDRKLIESIMRFPQYKHIFEH